MKILTILKWISAGILTVLGFFMGRGISQISAGRELKKAQTEIANIKTLALKSEGEKIAAVGQIHEIVEDFKEEKAVHEETIENVEKFEEAVKKLEKKEKIENEKIVDLINSDIADKLEFMRNNSPEPDDPAS